MDRLPDAAAPSNFRPSALNSLLKGVEIEPTLTDM